MKGLTAIAIQRTATVLLACFIVAAGSQKIQAQQVQSDYEIQKNFTQKVKSLQSSLDTLASVQGTEALISEIKTLENSYSRHKPLLNKVLYPDTFEQRMEELKRRTVSVQQRLATIQTQNKKLKELNDQVEHYGIRLNRLNARTDSLRTAMAKSVQSEKMLSSRVRSYRENLERRDRLILSIIDSVLIAYEDLNIESLNDLENSRQQSRIDAGGSPLKLIQSIAAENVQFLDSTPALTTQDYLRMNAVQGEFRLMWEKTGDRLVEIYASGNEQQTRGNIENAITEWNKKITNRLWTSIRQSFGETGIELAEFSDSEAFFSALSGYLDEKIETSKQNSGKASLEAYQNFSDFWNRHVKSRWAVFMTKGEVLTERQIAAIDQKISEWTIHSRPESNTLAYLLGVSLLAVVVLGVMLFREKSNHS